VEIPLPWERLLWSGRPSRLSPARALGERYLLTDFRLVRVRGRAGAEIAIADIAEVHHSRSRFGRVTGISTVSVYAKDPRTPPLVLHGVRNAGQLAALIELAAGDPRAKLDPEAVAAALAWRPQDVTRRWSEPLAALAAVLIAIVAVAIGLHGKSAPVAYAPDDRIYPAGQKNDHDAIVQFMTDEVMPWARASLGPLKGGPDRVRCETCHGRDAEARGWRMPGVAALPLPDVRDRGWERYGDMDAQMRNAIYGYVAESDKQKKAAYMREVVVPGMARLLHRQPYDFTKPYAYNRARAALGCYHCHKVK
jgi:hypothetical protein